MSHVEFARNSEELSEGFQEEFPSENNWTVTIQFYSYLHYVEQILQQHGYQSRRHKDREENIKDCKYTDIKAYKIYRFLYDTSRDARYECIEIDDESVEECREKLETGKEVLGFSDGKGTTKYST